MGVLNLLVDFFSYTNDLPIVALKSVAIVLLLVVAVAYLVYAERKILARINLRHGPSVVGPFGLLQPIADALKLVFKEFCVPSLVNRVAFFVAPIMVFFFALVAWAVIPLGNAVIAADHNSGLIGAALVPQLVANINVGVLFVLAISSMNVYSVIMAGWSSRSTYAFLGAVRSSSQMISYEVSMGFSVLSVVVVSGSMNFYDIAMIKHSLPYWVDLLLFPMAVCFFISTLAETSRHPFDLPEAESELVAGYNVEYSSTPFALFFLGEYANMILVSALMTVLFLGAWYPIFDFKYLYFIPPFVWFALKLCVLLFCFIWIRGTLPRYRYDQLMAIGWKFLLPITLVWLVLVSGAVLLFRIGNFS